MTIADLLVLAVGFDALSASIAFIALVRMRHIEGIFAQRLRIFIATVAIESICAAITLRWLDLNALPTFVVAIGFVGRMAKACGTWIFVLYMIGSINGHNESQR